MSGATSVVTLAKYLAPFLNPSKHPGREVLGIFYSEVVLAERVDVHVVTVWIRRGQIVSFDTHECRDRLSSHFL